MTSEKKAKLMELLHLLLDPISANWEAEVEPEGNQWRVLISTSDDSVDLVGENNEVIKAIQHLIRVLFHKSFPEDKTHFLLDINNYRKGREELIKNKIPALAQIRVLDDGRTMILTGLTGYERLLVHQILKEVGGLTTTSVGPDDDRKLLVMPTSEFGAQSMDNALMVDVNRLQ